MYAYKRVYLGKDDKGKSKLMLEHRKVMEDYLGRKLTNTEIVHHKDGNKHNNSLDNLELMTLTEHSRMHQKGKVLSAKTRKKLSEANKNKICNNRRLSKENIIDIALKYKETHNFRYVDRFFGLSNRTSRDIIKGLIYKDYQPLIQKLLK